MHEECTRNARLEPKYGRRFSQHELLLAAGTMTRSTHSSGEGVQLEAPVRAIDWRSPAPTCKSTPLPPILPATPEPR